MEVQPHFPHELTEPEGEDVRPLFILLSVFVSVNETHSTKGVLCALKGYFGSQNIPTCTLLASALREPAMMSGGR